MHNFLQNLARLLYQSAEENSYVNPRKVKEILGVTKEEAAAVSTGTGPAASASTSSGSATPTQPGHYNLFTITFPEITIGNIVKCFVL